MLQIIMEVFAISAGLVWFIQITTFKLWVGIKYAHELTVGSQGFPSPNAQVTWCWCMQSRALKAWKLELTISHGVSSPNSRVWHGCLHGHTFWRQAFGLVFKVRSSKKMDPTLNTSPTNTFVSNNQHPTSMTSTLLLRFLEAQKLGLCLHVGTCNLGWDSRSHVNRLLIYCHPILKLRAGRLCNKNLRIRD